MSTQSFLQVFKDKNLFKEGFNYHSPLTKTITDFISEVSSLLQQVLPSTLLRSRIVYVQSIECIVASEVILQYNHRMHCLLLDSFNRIVEQQSQALDIAQKVFSTNLLVNVMSKAPLDTIGMILDYGGIGWNWEAAKGYSIVLYENNRANMDKLKLAVTLAVFARRLLPQPKQIELQNINKLIREVLLSLHPEYLGAHIDPTPLMEPEETRKFTGQESTRQINDDNHCTVLTKVRHKRKRSTKTLQLQKAATIKFNQEVNQRV